MGFRDDRRGQAIQIGAVLLFGILILAFVGYQATVVPSQNERVEFDHNQQVQRDVVDLRNALAETATTGRSVPTELTLGVRYPPRAVFVNPAPGSGSLTTGDPGDVTVANAVATHAEAADYWSGSDRTFTTRSLRYAPRYSRYDRAPTTRYENSVVYNAFPSGERLPVTDQLLIDGRVISLVALQGDLSESRPGTVAIDPQAVSPATRTTTVQRAGPGDPVTVTLPTQLPEGRWRSLLSEELASNGGFIESLTVADGTLTLTFTETDGGQPVVYELRVGVVGVGSNVPDPTPTYIVDRAGDDTSIPEGGTQKLVVEVRDQYGNPVSGESVSASITTPAGGGGADESVTPGSTTTDEDGRAEFVYEAPSNVNGNSDAEITIEFDGGGSDPKTVVFTVRVLDSTGGGGGNGPGNGNGNPNN